MSLFLLSSRQLEASPQMTIIYDLEDIVRETCGAQLLLPQPRSLKRQDLTQPSFFSGIATKFLRRTVGEYHPLGVESHVPVGCSPAPQPPISPKTSSKNLPKTLPKTLMVFALNGAGLGLLSALPRWRQDFDLVVAYVLDCWILESYPAAARQIDHLFVPYPELKDQVQAHLNIPVSVLPIGFDVLNRGCGESDRPIDVMSYGRVSRQYHQALSAAIAQPNSALFYYRHQPEAAQWLPQESYGANRFDYQHRLQLNQMLRHTKLALAFENLYTSRMTQASGSHIIQRLSASILTTRWFECTASGCVVVGKRPLSSLVQRYLNWPNATLELPDDPSEGLGLIQEWLSQPEWLRSIQARNYCESLRRNDWRLRLRDLFQQLSLPLPQGLAASLEVLRDRAGQDFALPPSDLSQTRGEPRSSTALGVTSLDRSHLQIPPTPSISNSKTP